MSAQIKESEYWQQLKRGLDGFDVHMSRIENAAGSGISDVSACHRGVEVWLELKVSHGNKLSFRNTQRIWISKRSAVGGNVLLIINMAGETVIYKAMDVVHLPHKNAPDNRSFTVDLSDMPPPAAKFKKPIPWEEVLSTIFFTIWK